MHPDISHMVSVIVSIVFVSMWAAWEMERYYKMNSPFLLSSWSIWLWPMAKIILMWWLWALVFGVAATIQILILETIHTWTFSGSGVIALALTVSPVYAITHLSQTCKKAGFGMVPYFARQQIDLAFRAYIYAYFTTKLLFIPARELRALRIAITRDGVAFGRDMGLPFEQLIELGAALRRIRNSPNSPFEMVRETLLILSSWIGKDEAENLLDRYLHLMDELRVRDIPPCRIFSWYARVPFEQLQAYFVSWGAGNIPAAELRRIRIYQLWLNKGRKAKLISNAYSSLKLGAYICRRTGRPAAAELSLPWRKVDTVPIPVFDSV